MGAFFACAAGAAAGNLQAVLLLAYSELFHQWSFQDNTYRKNWIVRSDGKCQRKFIRSCQLVWYQDYHDLGRQESCRTT